MKKVAIIGSGISGLSMAFILHKNHVPFKVYEKNNYIGGHSRTINVKTSGNSIPVDTGFIVFNKLNYPNLTALFELLNVETVKSNMSFGVSINNGNLEYSGKSLKALFAQSKNLFNYKFYRMLYSINKFNKISIKNANVIDENISLKEYLEQLNLCDWFKNYYLLPMGGAIWSISVKEMLNFPAKTFIQFFNNHKLLTITKQPQWYSVKGGSKEYIKKLIAGFEDKIILNSEIKNITRNNNKIIVENEEFDTLIFACHSDDAIECLETPSTEERNIIGAINYKKNQIITHSDENLMPKNKKAWSSWVYSCNTSDNNQNAMSVTYWSNSLQQIDNNHPIFVSVNPIINPKVNKVHNVHEFAHPQFDLKAINAQKLIPSIQGKNNTYFVGAYTRYGFHEDGILSSANLALKLNLKNPWEHLINA